MKAQLIKRTTNVGNAEVTFKVSDIKTLDSSLNGIKIYDDVELTVGKPKKKRSLDANAYYWSLMRKVCDKYGTETTRYHNRNLAEVGVVRHDKSGKPMWTMKPADYDWEAELTAHYKPIPNKRVTIKDSEWDLYVEVVGSSEFDTKQMSVLIDMVVADANELGIETITATEKERLLQQWTRKEKKEGKRTT